MQHKYVLRSNKSRISYKKLYEASQREKDAVEDSINQNYIKRSSAFIMLQHQMLKSRAVLKKTEHTILRNIKIEKCVDAIYKYSLISQDDDDIKIKSIISYIIKSDIKNVSKDDPLIRNYVDDLKIEHLNETIRLISLRINRIELEEPHLPLDNESFFEGAMHIIHYLSSLRDSIENDYRSPFEDTTDYKAVGMTRDLLSNRPLISDLSF